MILKGKSKTLLEGEYLDPLFKDLFILYVLEVVLRTVYP